MLRSLLRNAPGSWSEEQDFPIDGGTVTWGHEVAVGYFSQDHQQSIDKGMTTLEWLHSVRSAGVSRKNCAGCSGRCCSAATMR